jgi:hypothetical protein
MQKAIRNAEFIGRELNGPVVAAAHPPKNSKGTIHGSGVIQNASVAIWNMEKKKKSELRTVKVILREGIKDVFSLLMMVRRRGVRNYMPSYRGGLSKNSEDPEKCDQRLLARLISHRPQR